MQLSISGIYTLLRGLLFAAVATVFLVGDLTATDQLAATVTSYQMRAVPALHLHSTANQSAPGQGLRQSIPEEVQRLEYLSGRDLVSRLEQSSGFFTSIHCENISADITCKSLLLLEGCRLGANLKSLAHTNLTARYPIPPPTTNF